MNNLEFKEKIIKYLYNTQEFFEEIKGSNGEFRTRCPLCGDSSNPHFKGHFYINIDISNNSDIKYNCFKCGKGGYNILEVLKAFGINDVNTLSEYKNFKRTTTKIDIKSVNKDIIYRFEYKMPEYKKSIKTEYIENRLGIFIDKDRFKVMKIIPSLYEFLQINDIHTVPFEKRILSILDKDYVGFITEGKSHILFRAIKDTKNLNWIKYPISKESNKNKVLYTMKSKIDIFTKDDIEINLTEGIFDILSASFNLGHNKENTLNIAVSGKGYKSALLYIINLGIIGENVIINIFADNDETFNKKAKDPTTIKYFENVFGDSKYLFKNINIYYNTIGKDIGVKKEHISLIKHVL